MQRGNIVSVSETVRKEETSLFCVILARCVLGQIGHRLQMLFLFWLRAHLTSRHSIAAAGSEKGFGMTVARGSLNKPSPRPPETQASRCIPAILLPKAVSFRSLDQEDKTAAWRVWSFIRNFQWKRMGWEDLFLPWDLGVYTAASTRKAWSVNRRDGIWQSSEQRKTDNCCCLPAAESGCQVVKPFGLLWPHP